MHKLYCYVDETGQDAASNIFVVVAVVSQQDQERLRQALTEIEHLVGIGHVRWAGCIRRALSGHREEQALFERALETNYIRRI